MSKNTCHDCGAKPGEFHMIGCDVERCAACGGQAISCYCEPEEYNKHERLPWTGEWPCKDECRALGWYSRMIPGMGWQACDMNDEGATEDLNRFVVEARWNPKERVYETKDKSGEWKAVLTN